MKFLYFKKLLYFTTLFWFVGQLQRVNGKISKGEGVVMLTVRQEHSPLTSAFGGTLITEIIWDTGTDYRLWNVLVWYALILYQDLRVEVCKTRLNVPQNITMIP